MRTRFGSTCSVVAASAIVLASLVGRAYGYDGDASKVKKAYDESRFSDVIRIAGRLLAKRTDFGALLLRGLAYQQTGQRESAVRDFSSAINLKQEHPAGYYARGDVYLDLKLWELALGDFSQALKYGADTNLVVEKRVVAYAALGWRDSALKDTWRILQRGKLSYDRLVELTDSYNRVTDTALARPLIARALALDSVRWDAFARRGYVFYVKKRTDSADADFARALYRTAGDTAAGCRLGEWFVLRQLYNWAIRAYSFLGPSFTSAPEAELAKGCAFFQLQQLDSAMSAIGRALSGFLGRGDLARGAEAYFRRGEVYEHLGLAQQAKADFSKAAKAAPKASFTKLDVPSATAPKTLRPGPGVSKPTAQSAGLVAPLTPAPATPGPETAFARSSPEPPVVRDGVHAAPVRVPPQLTFDYSISDDNGDMVLEGGEHVRLAVNVQNQGKGAAQDVSVRLSGSSKAILYLGEEQVVGDVAPGEKKTAMVEVVLPTRIDADNGNLLIKVREGRGYDPTRGQGLVVAMKPAQTDTVTDTLSYLIDVDQPGTASNFKRENAFAVIIGISRYRSSMIPQVKYARRDAEVVRQYLVDDCGVPEANIKFLVDSAATLGDLMAYTGEWLQKNVRLNSFVFVYFAGHGTPDYENGTSLLVPYDGEPGLVSKLYPLSSLYAALDRLPTDSIVVALDACFSGAGGRSVVATGIRPVVGAVKMPEPRMKTAVMAACAENEISQDFAQMKHGLFTYYMLKGLRGAADADRDGWITLGELYAYCRSKVESESRTLGYCQTPRLFDQPTGSRTNLKLARVP